MFLFMCCFFFKQKTAYEMRISDWSSDVCSSDLEDVKRFKREVAAYLGLEVTYANMVGWETKDPLSVCQEIGGFKGANQHVLCTTRLKTEPLDRKSVV